MFELTFLETLDMPSIEPIESNPIGTDIGIGIEESLSTFDSIIEYPGTESLSGGLTAIHTIYNSVYGIDIDPVLLEEKLTELGLWTPDDGMSLADIHKFMGLSGQTSALHNGGTLDELQTLLDTGYPAVVISCDRGELLSIDALDEDLVTGESADYAFVVTEVDFSDPEHRTVTLYNGDGESITVSAEIFDNAWADGGRDILIIGSQLVDKLIDSYFPSLLQ